MNRPPHAPRGRKKEEGRRTKWGGVSCFAVAGILAVALLVTGCLRHEPPADLTIINNAEPESLDPALVTGQPDQRAVQGLFEGLARNDPQTGRAIPGLAERWEISPDQCTYTFHLRTNLAWSTGEPITADDVVYSWIRALDPATASSYAGQLFYLKNAEAYNAGKLRDPAAVGVHAPDRFTVRVELNHPTPFFLELCTRPLLSVVPRRTIEAGGDGWIQARPLPCSGPYELVFWRLNDKIRLRRNTRYWDAARTRSDLIDLLPVGSPNAALNLYERGQADVVWDKELVPAELMDVLLKRPDFHTFNYLGTYFVRINVTRKPFDDARVRQALALALDKERLVQRLSRCGEQAAGHLVPEGTADYVPPAGLSFDPARARRLLAEAGYPGGKGFPRFEYLFNAAAGGGAKTHEKVAVELQQMWREVLGIEMELRQLEWKVFLNAQNRLDYDLSRSSWVGDYNDANTFLELFMSDGGNNRTGWKNPRYDGLLRQANAQTDLRLRARLLQEAETLLVRDELPIVPLYFYKGVHYYDPARIEGIYPNLVDWHPLQSIHKKGRGGVSLSHPMGEGRGEGGRSIAVSLNQDIPQMPSPCPSPVRRERETLLTRSGNTDPRYRSHPLDPRRLGGSKRSEDRSIPWRVEAKRRPLD
jgi:oligopeptide transport system substrate-binding protein